MTRSEYWQEAVSSSLESAGVPATAEQVAAIAADIEVSHDNIGMAFASPGGYGRDTRPDPKDLEIARLKAEAREEEGKVRCEHCTGRGFHKDGWGLEFTCETCRGAGRVKRGAIGAAR